MFNWKDKLHSLFDQRSRVLPASPTIDDLCWAAGRDGRVWREAEVREDLTRSILTLLNADKNSSVLEIGCAAGFLALLVAPHVAAYTGVDLAEGPLDVARRLGLENARFQRSDGGSLPYADGTFDAGFCYDVFTNFPSVEDGEPIIREMLRVVKPGGFVLIGNIPDRAQSGRLPERIAELGRELEQRYGPATPPPSASMSSIPAPSLTAAKSALQRIVRRLVSRPAASLASEPHQAPPEITCYDFERDDFHALAERLGARIATSEVHPLNPYVGFRFNALYSRTTG